eukprot:662114-Pyramimonas_sp.AAC.1
MISCLPWRLAGRAFGAAALQAGESARLQRLILGFPGGASLFTVCCSTCSANPGSHPVRVNSLNSWAHRTEESSAPASGTSAYASTAFGFSEV